jgi:hypothetical protein
MQEARYGQFNGAVCLINFAKAAIQHGRNTCCQIGRKTMATSIAEPIGANNTGHYWLISTYFNMRKEIRINALSPALYGPTCHQLIPIPSHDIPWTGARFAQLRVHSERISLSLF